MELTRRDAIAAATAMGLGAGAVGLYALEGEDDGPDLEDVPEMSADDFADLHAVAAVLYPEAVETTEEFLETYVLARRSDDETYVEGMVSGLAAIDERARSEEGEPIRALDPERRDAVLRGMELDVTPPDPSGTERERVRYYVINDLLYALYTTPVGGELVGTKNPPGHPGGLDSYGRGPVQ